MRHFLPKSWPRYRNVIVCSKSCKFWPNPRFFALFREMGHFFQLFAEKLTNTPKHDSLLKKFQVLTKSTIFRAFSSNEALFPTFCRKVHQDAKASQFPRKVTSCKFSCFFTKWGTFWRKVHQDAEIWQFARKVASSGQNDDFSSFFAKWGTFCNFLPKSWPKNRNMVVCSTKLQVLAKSTIFHAFSRNEARFAEKLT